MIYSHRLQQWVTRLPELEEETALANIALDLLGQARMLLARAGAITDRTEDELAFFRNEPEFRNVRLVEAADRDFAELVGRLLVFSTWRLALFERLSDSPDPVLAAIAAKGVKELTYHRDYAAQWVVRLGDGTERFQNQNAGRTRDDLAVGRRTVRRRRPGRARSMSSSTPCSRLRALTGRRRRRSLASADVPAVTACTPRRSATSSPSCRASPGPTRTRRGSDDADGLGRGRRDPGSELPMLTLADLGILRAVEEDGRATVAVITPTYSGCPAMREISRDVVHRLQTGRLRRRPGPHPTRAGVEQRLDHRRGSAQARRAPASRRRAPRPRRSGPIPLTLTARPAPVACPRCGVGRHHADRGVQRDRLQGAATAATPAPSRSST